MLAGPCQPLLESRSIRKGSKQPFTRPEDRLSNHAEFPASHFLTIQKPPLRTRLAAWTCAEQKNKIADAEYKWPGLSFLLVGIQVAAAVEVCKLDGAERQDALRSPTKTKPPGKELRAIQLQARQQMCDAFCSR